MTKSMTRKDKRVTGGAAATPSEMTLRQRADAAYSANLSRLQNENTSRSSTASSPKPPEDAWRLLHELQVHQIELEMQNQELREAQAELDASRARYFDLYDLAPVGYCTVNTRGLILQANLTAASMLGMARGALVKLPLSRFILDRDRNIYDSSRKHLVKNGEPLSCELRMVKGDGSQFWVHLTINAANDGDGGSKLRVVLSDITARKQAEEDLAKAEGLQHAIFNSANFSSIATDAQGVIQIFNVGAERMLGYSASEVMNKITPADISDPQELIARANALSLELSTPIKAGFEALAFKASRGMEDIYELTYVRKDGSRFPAVVSVTALRDARNTIIGYLLIGTDNTARQRVAAERILFDRVLRDKNVELELAVKVAEKANLAKSEFLSSMSHELRTPLNAILGFTQLIEAGLPPPTPSQQRSLEQILKGGWYLLELINEILDLALIESGKLSLSMEAVSLAEVMLECETMVGPQAEKYGIRLAFPKIEPPCFLKADPTRLKQILINLLSNAIKYNRLGGTVTVDCVLKVPDSMRISIQDTGHGLAPDQISQLFQPFNRLGQEAIVEEGTGIGLVVCKRLVEYLGGRIGVESTVGTGSVFWIELELTDAPQPGMHLAEAAAATQAHQAPVHTDAPVHTLLYVEDNPANLKLVEDIIERRSDIRLLTAMSGKQGIELARAMLPDVILMDINLPGISGITVLKALSEDPLTSLIPVVALSANAMPGDIVKSLEAGFFRYLTKPIKINEFIDTLDVALEFGKTHTTKRAL